MRSITRCGLGVLLGLAACTTPSWDRQAPLEVPVEPVSLELVTRPEWPTPPRQRPIAKQHPSVPKPSSLSASDADKILGAERQIDEAIASARKHYLSKRFKYALKELERAMQLSRWLAKTYDRVRPDRERRIEALVAQTKRDEADWIRGEEVRRRTLEQRRRKREFSSGFDPMRETRRESITPRISAGLDQSSWKPSTTTPGDVRLVVDERPLPMLRAQLRIRGAGHRLRVVMELDFAHEVNRIEEGTFQLRLPEGASPYLLAFGDVSEHPSRHRTGVWTSDPSEDPFGAPPSLVDGRWSKVRVARIAGRKVARRAYTTIVEAAKRANRPIDPALLEWRGQGIFDARVYPLLEMGEARVVVGYDLDLTELRGEDALSCLRLALPILREGKVAVDLDLAGLSRQPELAVDGVALALSGNASNWRARYDGAGSELTLALSADGALVCGGDPRAGQVFVASLPPLELPSAIEPAQQADEALFLLDTSHSSRPLLARWVALLLATLERNPTIERFNVLAFDLGQRWFADGWQANDARSRTRLASWLAALRCEGATDLEAALRRAAELPGGDLFLLSDGSPSWGSRERAGLLRALGRRALIAYRETPLLQALCEAHGGVAISGGALRDLVWLTRAHLARPWLLRAIQLDGARTVVAAGDPRSVRQGQRLRLLGRGSPDAEVVLSLERSGELREVRIPLRAVRRSPLAARAYGIDAIGALEKARVSFQLTDAYAMRYRVPGPRHSLVMLESEKDYREWRIAGATEEHLRQVLRHPLSAALEAARQRDRDARSALLSRMIAWQHAPGTRFRLSAALRRLIERAPLSCFAPASGGIGSGLAARDTQSALRSRSSLLDSQPTSAERTAELGMQALASGRPAQAISAFEGWIQQRPDQWQAQLALGLAYEAADRPLGAIMAYELAAAVRNNAQHSVAIPAEALLLRLLTSLERRNDALGRFARRRLPALRKRPSALPRQPTLLLWAASRCDLDLSAVHSSEPLDRIRPPVSAQSQRGLEMLASTPSKVLHIDLFARQLSTARTALLVLNGPRRRFLPLQLSAQTPRAEVRLDREPAEVRLLPAAKP